MKKFIVAITLVGSWILTAYAQGGQLGSPRMITEQAEKTEQTGGFSGFRLFRFFRLFRNTPVARRPSHKWAKLFSSFNPAAWLFSG